MKESYNNKPYFYQKGPSFFEDEACTIPLKLNGQTAKEWAEDLFRYENCIECGKDKEHHHIIPFLGGWFAYCIADDPAQHWYPSEGWAVVFNTDKGYDQIQKIDDLGILESDDEAVKLAIQKGFKVGTKDDPYKLVDYPKN